MQGVIPRDLEWLVRRAFMSPVVSVCLPFRPGEQSRQAGLPCTNFHGDRWTGCSGLSPSHTVLIP
jgi:hypothetical protein